MEQSPTAEHLCVLVVDDEEMVRTTLCNILRKFGFRVVEACGGREAIQALPDANADVVVTDISMPETNGIELLEAIRARDPDLPVVLMTGLPALDTAVQAVELGAFRYLMKPFEAKPLVDTVHMAGKLFRMTRMRRSSNSEMGTLPPLSPGEEVLHRAFSDAATHLWFAYQPVWFADGVSIAGYEALMRSSDAAFPNPGAILNAAERTGRILELGRLVRERAPVPWLSRNDDCLLFINLHPAELHDPALLEPEPSLAELAPRVVLEITEREKLHDLEGLEHTLDRLRELGFRLALDDLGAGYASLNAFAVLRPDFVKLDMALIRAIDHDPIRQRLVASMLHVCDDLGIPTVAEGIETTAERDTVVELGAKLLQGFLLGRPARIDPK